MKLPPNVRFEEELGLFIWRPRRVINESAVNKVITFLGDQEALSLKPFHRYTDTLAADAVDLNFRYIFHVSLFRRLSYSGRPPVKSAILATSSTISHYAKMHALLTQGSPLKVRVFQSRTKVAEWLGLPEEALQSESSSA